MTYLNPKQLGILREDAFSWSKWVKLHNASPAYGYQTEYMLYPGYNLILGDYRIGYLDACAIFFIGVSPTSWRPATFTETHFKNPIEYIDLVSFKVSFGNKTPFLRKPADRLGLIAILDKYISSFKDRVIKARLSEIEQTLCIKETHVRRLKTGKRRKETLPYYAFTLREKFTERWGGILMPEHSEIEGASSMKYETLLKTIEWNQDSLSGKPE